MKKNIPIIRLESERIVNSNDIYAREIIIINNINGLYNYLYCNVLTFTVIVVNIIDIINDCEIINNISKLFRFFIVNDTNDVIENPNPNWGHKIANDPAPNRDGY